VSLTERLSIEADGAVVTEERFGGRQARVLFAYLLVARGRPVPTDELAETIWGATPPARWEKGLSVRVSKLRALLNECGVDGGAALTSAFGCYQLTLPAGTWIDVVAADEAAIAAERALAAGEIGEAQAGGTTAASLARRTFLPGEDGRWVEEQRAQLREILVRALDCLAEANRLDRDTTAAVRAADELVALEPFRERGYRLLMQAQSAAGNDAEALRTYERCRTLLAEELGTYPSEETERLYRGLLEAPAAGTGAPVEHNVDGLPSASQLPASSRPPKSGLRRRLGLAAVALLVVGGAAIAVAVAGRDEALPVVLPNSVVRIDPDTLEVTDVVPVGDEPDMVIVAGGFVWVTHHILRDVNTGVLRDAGDRTLTRVDPDTGEVEVVGGGLAPCGLTADPSGDVWVANCFAAGLSANVVRVDARTLDFEATWTVPPAATPGDGFYRGIAYGGGSLWVTGVAGGDDSETYTLTEVDPQTGKKRSVELDEPATDLAWSEGYGDMWISNFTVGSVSRMHTATGVVQTVRNLVISPSFLVVDGEVVWVSDWNGPQLARLHAVGSPRPRDIQLPANNPVAGVWNVDAGAGAVWAATPRDGALWRIDPKTNATTRIPVPHLPTFVAADADGLWVTVRAG
jgi:DNA-binding SARP family transcriptional activator/streptogramin lyase